MLVVQAITLSTYLLLPANYTMLTHFTASLHSLRYCKGPDQAQ